MEIKIDGTAFKFGGRRFGYSFYFTERETLDYLFSGDVLWSGELCKWLLGKWANALARIDAEHSPMFLPFLPDDQGAECLRAEYRNGNITFTHVEVRKEGWAFDWKDVEGFITSPQELYEPIRPVLVGTFDKDDVISALLNARVVDEL